MNELALFLAAGGAGAVAIASTSHKSSPAKRAQPAGTPRSVRARLIAPTAIVNSGTAGIYDPVMEETRRERYGTPGSPVGEGQPPAPQEVVDQMIARAKADFEALPAEAKRAGCAKLKAQFADSPQIQALDCDASFGEIVNALCAAGGTAIGTAFGGPVGGAVGAIVGAYVGKAIDDYAQDAWDAVRGGIGDAAEAIAGAASEVWDTLF